MFSSLITFVQLEENVEALHRYLRAGSPVTAPLQGTFVAV